MKLLTAIGLGLAATFTVTLGSWIILSVTGGLLDGRLHGCEAVAAVVFAVILGGGSVLLGLVFVAFATDTAKDKPKGD